MNHFDFVAEEVADKDHDFYGKDSENTVKHSSGFSFKAKGKLAGDYDIQLIGDFNQDNAMAAGLACLRLGASLEDIKKGLLKPLFQAVWKFSLRQMVLRYSSTMLTMVTA